VFCYLYHSHFCKIWLGDLKGKRSIGRRRLSCEDNIRMDPVENWVARCGLDVSGSGYGPVAGSCEHGNEPSGSIKGWEFLD
jgi:hypothetical protein